MKSHFQFVEPIYLAGKKDSLGSLYVCRVKFELTRGTLTTEKRVELLRASGVKIKLLRLWDQRPLPSGVDFLGPFIRHDERIGAAAMYFNDPYRGRRRRHFCGASPRIGRGCVYGFWTSFDNMGEHSRTIHPVDRSAMRSPSSSGEIRRRYSTMT